jgi:MFS family permease
VATLGAFASFAVGFAARPIGAVIFAHLGDRVGRRRLIIAVSMIGLVT